MGELYRTFCDTGQEAVRLLAALQGFFAEENVTVQERDGYARYLKRRLRPAVQRLLDQDSFEEILKMEELGWFGARELDEFIRYAQQKGREAAMLALLRRKDAKYGYRDRDFTL